MYIHVLRELILMDAARHIDSKSLLNDIVYDVERILSQNETPIPPTDAATSEEVIKKPASLEFQATDESCNLRMAIQV